MDQLVQSIKERGVLTAITLRVKEDGRYEVVSGHRRKKACELAGLETVRAEIKELTRDEAVILMVDSNYQRSSILPSEKAFAYKMKLDAMLFRFQIEGVDRDVTGHITRICGNHQRCGCISPRLYSRLRDNGASDELLKRLFPEATTEVVAS